MAPGCENLPVFPKRPVVRTFAGRRCGRRARKRGDARHIRGRAARPGEMTTQLPARDMRAVVTGPGLIRVTATASLDAAVPGDGAIIYGGNPPHLATSITGTGAVLRG